MELIDFTSFTFDETRRLDADYLLYVKNIEQPVLLSKYFDIIAPEEIEPPTDSFNYCEIRNLDKFGQVAPSVVDLSVPPSDDEEEKLHKKISEGDIILPRKGTILLAKTRIYLGAIRLIVPSDTNYYTKAFHQIKPTSLISDNDDLRGAIGYIIIQSVLRDALISVSRFGKSYPTIDIQDLYTLHICENKVKRVLQKDELNAHATNILEKVKSNVSNLNALMSILNDIQSW